MPNFLKSTVATLLGLCIFFGLGIAGLLAFIIMGVRDSTPQVKDKSVLVLDLALSIQDIEPDLPPNALLSQSLQVGNPASAIVQLNTVVNAIDRASRDPRIVGLYIQGSSSPGTTGFANLLETRQALQRFRDSGKPIIAYDVDWSEREYYLGSVASELFMNPLGTLVINGLSAETTFFTGTLQKYGIDVQVSRVGKYKSAVEPFLLKENSQESQEQTQSLLSDLWGEWLQTVASSRKSTPEKIQALVDSQGTLLPEEAVQQKLIDREALPSDIITQLKQLTKADKDDISFPQIDLATYATATDKDKSLARPASKNRVAVLYAQGEIRNGGSATGEVVGESFAKQLRKLRDDKDVKAIVLRINSPGGSVTASEIIQEEVIAASKVKPVIVSMGNVAASGGYWIATYADRIFAEPTTVTGSIGVFSLIPNIQKLGNSQGITWDTVKTGKYADTDSITRPLTTEELAINQKIVDWIYGKFLDKVVESRKLSKAKVSEIAQGRVWSGVAAKKIGLVDELGGLRQAIVAAAKQAKLGDDWQIDQYPANRSLTEQLLGINPDVSAQSFAHNPLMTEYLNLQQMVMLVQSLDDPRGLYVRLPFNLKID